MPELENHALPPSTNDSWRTWLMTGSRRAPVDRRRVRGAHKGIKKMLVEGMATPAKHPYSWKEFSDAMVRQSVGDAMGALPLRDAQVVKLAYFGGMSNHEIADRLGLSVAAVERRLRMAITLISRHVERGRAIGRRAVGAVIVWLSGHWIGDAVHHVAQVGAVATAVAIVAVAPVTLEASGRPGSNAHAARLSVRPGGPGAQAKPYAPPSAASRRDPAAPSVTAVTSGTKPILSLPITLPVPLATLTRKVPAVSKVQLPLRA